LFALDTNVGEQYDGLGGRQFAETLIEFAERHQDDPFHVQRFRVGRLVVTYIHDHTAQYVGRAGFAGREVFERCHILSSLKISKFQHRQAPKRRSFAPPDQVF